MFPPTRSLATWLTLTTCTAGLALIGCSQPPGDTVEPTPSEVITPEISGETETVAPGEIVTTEEETVNIAPPAEAEMPAPPVETPAPTEPEPTPEPEATDSASVEEAIELRPVTYEELRAHIASGNAPLTLVDCWASWCDPCKENFPHVIEMAETYGDKGLKVIALSFDAGTEVDDIDAAQIKEAQKFLSGLDVSKIENLRQGQLLGESFEAFNVTTNPAVFLYD